MLLEMKNLNIKIQGKKILNDFSLAIREGETHVIMGPNGTGKSTLSKVIMAHPDYILESGDILLNQESILSLSTDERAKRGIFLAMQNPLSIEGVSNSEFLRTALSEKEGKHIGIFDFMKEMDKAMKDLKMDDNMLHRSINQGCSGGERKKNEVLQLKILRPSFIILDELDSGLDVDSLKIVCENINQYKKDNPNTSILIITHYPRILEYIKPDYVHMMVNGKIQKTGDLSFAFEIEKSGYHGLNDISEMTYNE